MPEWLFKKDNYSLPADRDGFINKSLLSILSTLAAIKRGGSPSTGLFYQINATLKFIFTFSIVLFLSLSHSLQYVMLIDAFLLLTLGLLELKDIKRTASVSLTVGLFTAFILLPSALAGNRMNSFMLALKISGSVMAINVLANSTKWSRITHSMKVFRIPGIFILVLDIAIKYIVLLGEFSLQMLYALRLRSVGKNNKKHQSVSHLMGNLFLKSKEMAELTYSAMECRCFDGQYALRQKQHFRRMDFVYMSANSFLVLAFFVL